MTLVISKHAVERYQQRVRPLSEKRARKELWRLIKRAEWHSQAPGWVRTTMPHDRCLVIGGLALIVQGNVVATCLTRGTISPGEREARRRWKKRRRAALARKRGL